MDPISRRISEFVSRVRAVKTEDLYFYLQPVEALEGAYVTIGGRSLLLGSSYSYLGLLGHPAIQRAAHDTLSHYGTGTHGVRLLAGNTDLHDRLERRISSFSDTAAAVVYSSGYLANVAVIAALVGRSDAVICDKLNHASIVDGCLLSGAKFIRVPHNDTAALVRELSTLPASTGKLVIVDGVFSMDGDVINLPEIVGACRQFQAKLMVDESHSLGVLGPEGRGIESHFGLDSVVDVKMSSLSKSIPSAGGYIAGSEDLITYLKHVSRAFVFSAALPPASAAAAIAALDVMEREPDRVRRVQSHARALRARLRDGGIPVREDPTPIVPVITGDDTPALRISRALYDRGVFVPPIVSPAVPPKTSRLRVTVTAAHNGDEVDRIGTAVVEAWHEVMREATVAQPVPGGPRA